MTCSDFVRNLKGTDLQYENIPVEYLEGIYNDVKETPIVEKYNNEARTFSDQETNTGRLESLLRGTKTASINFAPQTKGDAFDMERTLLAVRSVVSHFFSNNWQEWHGKLLDFCDGILLLTSSVPFSLPRSCRFSNS